MYENYIPCLMIFFSTQCATALIDSHIFSLGETPRDGCNEMVWDVLHLEYFGSGQFVWDDIHLIFQSATFS